MAGPSPHFSWSEFDCHDGTPCPVHAHRQLRDLARRYLEPLRSSFGPVTIVSGYRTAEYNHAVGGAQRSFHVYQRGRQGVAVDLVCKAGTPPQWAAELERLGVPGLGRYDSHVHADNRGYRARW